ncbi:hypothetical protein M407DRAFT_244049 [Tulasnella calospora MUT 4182]|uniref:Uncharacterized protein n=1 Tax=Tulasnella calospora MUT 4182 TaxID=1051891 RepID=A0A0C3QGM1_9AGAM|nr:hypothetical protein M407DRAFT_244049 [Tulasnella calospora MUT 4182]
MAILKNLSVVWPSAKRAGDLLDGVKIDVRRAELALLQNAPERKKRSAGETEVPRQAPGGSSSRRTSPTGQPSSGVFSRAPSGGPSHPDPALNQYALPPIQRSAAALSSANSDYRQRSPPHNTQGYNSPSFSDPSAMIQSSYDAPVQSYETWSSQPPQHSARQSLGQSPTSQLSSHAVPSSYQHASVSEPQYSYASSHVTLPPLSSYTQGIAGTTLPSQPSPFQDQFTSSPVPPDNQRFSNAGSGYWNGYQNNDPFGDPSLLSYASVVQPRGPQGYDGGGAQAVMQAALHESHPPHLPAGYSAINAYFSDTGSSGVYYGSGSRPSQ